MKIGKRGIGAGYSIEDRELGRHVALTDLITEPDAEHQNRICS